MLPLKSFAKEEIYTIQVASSTSQKDVLKNYEKIQQVLNEKELEYLRIEKVGKYYTVRLAKYEDNDSIRKFLKSIKSRIPSAISRKSYFIEERIVKSYTGMKLTKEEEDPEKPLPIPEVEKAESEITDKKPVTAEATGTDKSLIEDKAKEAPAIAAPEKIIEIQKAAKVDKHKPVVQEEKLTVQHTESMSVVTILWVLTLSALMAVLLVLVYMRFFMSKHSVQTGSFLSEEDALDHYESVKQMLVARELEHLRAEKAGNYYSVRVGNFTSAGEAHFLLPSLKSKFPSATIVRARINKDKCLKHYAEKPDDLPDVEVSEAGDDSPLAPEMTESYRDDTAGISVTQEESQAARVSDEIINEKTERASPLTIKACKEAVIKSPDSAKAHDNLGIAYSKAGMHKYAIKSHKKAIKLNPNYAGAYYNLGMACTNLVMLKDAIKAYKKAIKIKPDFAEAHYSLGNTLVWSGMYNEAIASYKRAISLKPEYPEAYHKLGAAYGQSELYDDAIKAHKKAIEQKPNFAVAYNTLGEMCSKAGKLHEAIEAYKGALDVKPHYAKACFNLGMAYSKTGMTEEAVEAYQHAIDINPKFAEAHNNLGLAYRKLDRVEDAIDAHRQAIKIKPNYEEARRNLEIAYNE
jgi:tetratricopeptide (TPR) repeat protein